MPKHVRIPFVKHAKTCQDTIYQTCLSKEQANMAVDHLKQGQKLVNSTLALPGVVELKQKQNSQTMPHVLFLWSSCKARLMFWTWNNRSLDKRSCDGRAHQIATKGHCSKIEMVKVLSQTSYILFPPLQCSTSFWHLFWHSFWHIFAVEGTPDFTESRPRSGVEHRYHSFLGQLLRSSWRLWQSLHLRH